MDKLSNVYDRMMSAYNTNESVFASTVTTLLDTLENPFAVGEFGHDEFEDMLLQYKIWRRGGVGSKISGRRMMEKARRFADFGIPNPYTKKEDTNPTKEQIEEDVKFVIDDMNNAHQTNDEVTFEQDAIHLVDIAVSNPYKYDTKEYKKFEDVMSVSGDKKKMVEAAKELCDTINGTVKLDKPMKVLNVVSDKKRRHRK